MNVLSMRVNYARLISALSVTLAIGVCAGNAMAYSPGATYGEMRYAQYERGDTRAAEREEQAEQSRSGGNKAAYEQMMRSIEEGRGGGHKQPVAKDAGSGKSGGAKHE